MCHLPGEFAFRIVRTADESTEFAEFQAETAIAAGRAGPNGLAVFVYREEVRAKLLVEGRQHIGDFQVLGLVDRFMERFPEVGQDLFPGDCTLGDIIEGVFQLRRKVVLHVAGKEVGQEGSDQPSPVFGNKAALVENDIVPVLQNLQDAGIGRGPADAEFLKPLHQACFAVARRRLREMLLRLGLVMGQRFAFLHGRQQASVLVFLAALRRLVPGFLIQFQEAIEGDDGTGGAEFSAAVGGLDGHGGLVQLGAGHLAGDGALPDQLVEPGHVLVEPGGHLARVAAHIGWPDRLVGFLRVLRLVLVHPRAVRQIPVAEILADIVADGEDGILAELYAVGTHIGDQADRLAAEINTLVELLRELHGARRAEAELA